VVPQPRWLDQARDDDVLCCVKRFISDGGWAQPPVVVLPQGGLSRLATHLPSEVVSRVVHADASDKWRKAAVFVQRMVAVNNVFAGSRIFDVFGRRCLRRWCGTACFAVALPGFSARVGTPHSAAEPSRGTVACCAVPIGVAALTSMEFLQ